jgi:hypothetical protein
MRQPTIPSSLHRLGLRVAALVVAALLVAAMAGPAIVEEERSLARAEAASPSGDDLSGLADDGALPLNVDPSILPPVLREIAEHVHPAFGTDGSHDIPNAAKSHDDELDREAAEGMERASSSGPDRSEARVATALDESIAAARARRGEATPLPLGVRARPSSPASEPRPAEGLGPRRRR